MGHFSPSTLLLHVELPMRATFLFSIERREARRIDSWVILCRRPAIEWRSLREHRTELRRELCAVPAIAILAAVRPGSSSSFFANSADIRSDVETLTTISGEGIVGGQRAVLPLSSGSSSAWFTELLLSISFSSTNSGFLFCTPSVWPFPREWLTSSAASNNAGLCLRVERLGCVVVLASEVDAGGTLFSSAMKFSDLTVEPRRLLRFPFENLDRKSERHNTFF